jgi:hypothetical protein
MKRVKQGTQPRSSAKKKHLGRYKSGLEKQCADLLSDNGLSFVYEEREYVLVDGFFFDGEYFKMTASAKGLSNRSRKSVLPIKYTPDFMAQDGSWIIETKGFTPSHHDFSMRWKLFLLYISKLEVKPKLFLVKNKFQIEEAIRIIKSDGNTEARPRQGIRPRYEQDTFNHD